MSRTTQDTDRLRIGFVYRVVTFFDRTFQSVLLPLLLASSQSYNPGACLATKPVWAPPRSLAATQGITFVFFSSGYLDVSVPPVSPLPLAVWYPLRIPGCPIRTSAGLRIFAPDRSFSQLITSFFAFESLRHPPCALAYFFLFCSQSTVNSQQSTILLVTGNWQPVTETG